METQRIDIASTMDEDLFDVGKIKKAMLLKDAILEMNSQHRDKVVASEPRVKVQEGKRKALAIATIN